MNPRHPGYFSLKDFDVFCHLPEPNEYEKRFLAEQSEQFLDEKIKPLYTVMRDELGFSTSRIGYDNRDFSYVHLAFFDTPQEEKDTFLNIFIGKRNVQILTNTEYPSSIGAFYHNLEENPEEFDALVAALPEDRRFSSRLYTKIPLGPVGWDEYYFQLVVKFSQRQTSAASIMKRIDGVRTGFDKAMRKGLTTMEIDPRYGEEATAYYKSFYQGRNAKKTPEPDAFMTLRFEYLIPLSDMLNRSRDEIAAEWLRCAAQLRPFITFGNQ
ncbi:hypothetical protein [Methanogenium organophilum]|uniref:Uncharacterized protein n=1 Tax=Methanogenium organophilum TaxID=2199 RepID=A0A9X9S293_METOG|nr:hypothetical protein [Methanogenium organophilum]WAI00208.1 hypothetical protein OU421_07125 [Methanogenium organophilum]